MDNDQLYDIYDMIHVPWWQTAWVRNGAIGLACLFLSLIAWYGIRRIRARKRMKTSWEEALDSLHALNAAGGVQRDDYYYLRLTTIIKTYLQQRYALDLQGKTDDELVECLEKALIPLDIVEQVRALLRESVMIKFAQVPALAEQKERSLAASIAIITKTVPTAPNAPAAQ